MKLCFILTHIGSNQVGIRWHGCERKSNFITSAGIVVSYGICERIWIKKQKLQMSDRVATNENKCLQNTFKESSLVVDFIQGEMSGSVYPVNIGEMFSLNIEEKGY